MCIFFIGKSSVCCTGSHCYLFSWWYIYWTNNTASIKLPAGIHNGWEWKEGWRGCTAMAQLDATVKHVSYTSGEFRERP